MAICHFRGISESGNRNDANVLTDLVNHVHFLAMPSFQYFGFGKKELFDLEVFSSLVSLIVSLFILGLTLIQQKQSSDKKKKKVLSNTSFTSRKSIFQSSHLLGSHVFTVVFNVHLYSYKPKSDWLYHSFCQCLNPTHTHLMELFTAGFQPSTAVDWKQSRELSPLLPDSS